MAKIPFDIKYRPQIESGEYKVESRDGRPVRIICWDKKDYPDIRESHTPIIYLLLSKCGCEHVMCCDFNGMYPDGLKRDCDLFIITPEPEMKESEDERIRKAIEGTIRVYGKTQGEHLAGYDMDTLVVHLRDAFYALEKQKQQNTAETNGEHKCACVHVGCHINNCRRWCHYCQNEIPYDRCNSDCVNYNRPKPMQSIVKYCTRL